MTPREYVTLAVSDTGTGMPSDVLVHAFEPFFSTKDVGQGSGLGLSMVYGFARQSGGHATIDSEEGKGSTVKIFLPRSSARCDGGKKHPLDAVLPSVRGERVLVVEDDADVRALAVALLGNLGYQTLEAATAKAALEVVERSPVIDLLLSDIVLPGGMNGRDLAGAIQRRWPAVKLLYMSGYTEGAISTLARRNGGPRLLQKPFKKADFAAAVRQALDGGEALA